jgi:predicted nucleotidyltransferase
MGLQDRSRGPIEGYYIETIDGLLFSVKGLHHPDGLVIAYLRYIPDPNGDRERDSRRYRRVYDLGETYEFLKEHFPQYLNPIERKDLTLQSVPVELISRVYSPAERLLELIEDPASDLEVLTAKFVSALSSESHVRLEEFGVSGSLLIGLDGPNSDVDVVVYGLDAGREAYEALRRLRESPEWIRPYDSETVMGVVSSRWGDTGIDLEKYIPREVGKVLHGLVDDREYFVRLVLKPWEYERERGSRPLGRAVLRTTMDESGYSIFTPCTYQVEDCSYVDQGRKPGVTRLVSYRGKFTEQAEEGDLVEARGTLEEVYYKGRTIYRLMLGGRGDYLVPVGMLDR